MPSCLTLKKTNCKNCYKCVHHCPVKAIRISGNQAHIIENECILCGKCFVVCPQNAKEISSELEKVKVLLQGSNPVVVSLAPSFVANYHGVGIQSMREALKKLGFYNVEETAIGATIVKKEYERMLRDEDRDVIISSCCHSINLLIQKRFPKAMAYLADVISPMQAHCQDIKKRIPNAKTVFIGPCIAKKDEAEHYAGFVDAVLTYDELSNWLKNEGIELRQEMDTYDHSRARLFPTTAGVINTMEPEINGFRYLAIDGVEDCMTALQDIEDGKIHKCFIELSACEGSCINGPVMEKYHSSPLFDNLTVASYAGKKDFEVVQPPERTLRKRFEFIEQKAPVPTENEIMAIMRQMGKFKASQELNCGSCGYDTCREKAIAVFQGKAEISMCLPYLMEKAESFSDAIVQTSPYGMIVLNEQLEVQQINRAAMKIMNIRNDTDILGDQVIRILDPTVFIKVLDTRRDVHDERVYLAEYKRFVEQTVVYDDDSRLLIGIIRDITNEEKDRVKKDNISRQTIEVADKVVDKQMRIVQEIALLLGETAAETKIALTKLKESIEDE